MNSSSLGRSRVVITGVAGFIGSNLAERLLSLGYLVVGIDNLRYGVREQIPNGVEFHQLDICSPEIYTVAREGDVIFHLAAKNCISDCQNDPVETASINVVGTVHVFEMARRARVQKVIYAESSALYEGSKRLPTPEHDVQPQSFYAASKLGGMAFAKAYQHAHGLRMTALRYFCVYGPRQDYRRTIPPVMSAFILRLLRGQRPVIYGTGTKRRDFVHIDDINNFHVQCLTDSRTDGRVFNLGSGTSYSVREIYEIIAEILGTNLPPIYRPDLPGEAEETLADISAAMALGWRPQVGLQAGLRGLANYYIERGIAWQS